MVPLVYQGQLLLHSGSALGCVDLLESVEGKRASGSEVARGSIVPSFSFILGFILA